MEKGKGKEKQEKVREKITKNIQVLEITKIGSKDRDEKVEENDYDEDDDDDIIGNLANLLTKEFVKEALSFSLHQQIIWTDLSNNKYPRLKLFDGIQSTMSIAYEFYSKEDSIIDLKLIFKQLKLNIKDIIIIPVKNLDDNINKKISSSHSNHEKSDKWNNTNNDINSDKKIAFIPSRIALPKILKFFSSRISAPSSKSGIFGTSSGIKDLNSGVQSSTSNSLQERKEIDEKRKNYKSEIVSTNYKNTRENLIFKLNEIIDELIQFRKSNRIEIALNEIRSITDEIKENDNDHEKTKNIRDKIQLKIGKFTEDYKSDLSEYSKRFFESIGTENWKDKIGVKFVKYGNKVAWVDKRAENDWIKFSKDHDQNQNQNQIQNQSQDQKLQKHRR